MIKLPRHSLVFILICAVGVLAYWSLAVFPVQRTQRELEREIARIRRQLKTQQALLPLYSRLLALRQKGPAVAGDLAPALPVVGLASQEIRSLPARIGSLASQQGVVLEQAQLDVESMINETGQQGVNVLVRGDLEGFRRFIVQMGRKFPSLAAIEKLEIRSLQGRSDLELDLHLRMARGEGAAAGKAASPPGVTPPAGSGTAKGAGTG